MARHSYAAALALSTIAACGGDDQATADAGPDAISAACLEATQHSDLTWLQDNVFQRSCAGFADCHKGAATSASGLSLERGQTRTQMVGVDSVLFPQYKRVVAGNAAESYLMIISGKYQGPLSPKGTMPYNSSLLCREKLDALERWINAGAPDEL
jgi:hypothetical protein